MASPYASYLTEEIPPCTPAPGSSVDPCEVGEGLLDVTSGSVAALVIAPPPDVPHRVGDYLDGFGWADYSIGHIVVRGTYLPDTIRCTSGNTFQEPDHLLPGENEPPSFLSNALLILCYADVRVNAYVVGMGPSTLTVIVTHELYGERGNSYYEPAEVEALRAIWERALTQGGRQDHHPYPHTVSGPTGGIAGREAILFLGPSSDASTEAWRAYTTWDLQRREDGTVVAVHPDRYHRAYRDDFEQMHSQLEMELPTFKQAAQAADKARVTANSGRIRPEPDFPMLVSDANQLSGYVREVGGYDDADNPPAQPPPPCGLAVPNHADNPGLMRDCTALLAAKDALRGTATLNWSVERPIAEWDGVTTGGTPLRVTRLELPDKSLSGSVPDELGRLSGLTRLDLSSNSLTGALPEELELLSNLTFIRLAGNSFTGCVPYALRNVADSDLGSAGIPYCPAPVCIQPFPDQRVFNPTLQMKREPFTHAMQSWDRRCRSSHAPTHNAQFYTFVNHDVSDVNGETVLATMRVNIKMTTRHDDVSLLLLGAQFLEGLEPDAPIVATAQPVEAEAGALRTLEIEKVVPYGSYSIEVRARNPGDAVFDLTAAHVEEPGPPAFAQDSYTFSVAEDAGQFTSVGTVAATDPGDEAVTYRITSGAAGKFSIDANEGIIVVRAGLDYETTPTYTLTVEARNSHGLMDTATVTINVTDVAGK